MTDLLPKFALAGRYHGQIRPGSNKLIDKIFTNANKIEIFAKLYTPKRSYLMKQAEGQLDGTRALFFEIYTLKYGD